MLVICGIIDNFVKQKIKTIYPPPQKKIKSSQQVQLLQECFKFLNRICLILSAKSFMLIFASRSNLIYSMDPTQIFTSTSLIINEI
jgi:hypothetical protein